MHGVRQSMRDGRICFACFTLLRFLMYFSQPAATRSISPEEARQAKIIMAISHRQKKETLRKSVLRGGHTGWTRHKSARNTPKHTQPPPPARHTYPREAPCFCHSPVIWDMGASRL